MGGFKSFTNIFPITVTCALYRDKNKVPKNGKLLLESQHFPAKSIFELDEYDNMSSEDILE
ncbi:13303_t:CDS:1, partial [Gigaspora rosea]